MTTTPDMNLVLPVVSSTIGPDWASLLNAALALVDSHDHSSGKGALITPAGLDINSDLDLQSNDLLNILSARLAVQSAPVLTALRSIQNVNGNFYWINAAGVAVQITTGNVLVNTGSGLLTYAQISAYPYSILTSDAQKILGADTSAARTFNLPAATNLMTVYIKDYVGSADTNNVSVVPLGTDTIDGVNSTFLIDSKFSCIGFISNGVANWMPI